jgi:hypothetical protein
MNLGKTVFAQIMEFVPWKSFARIVERHRGDVGVSELSCAEVFRVMAFAQLSWRESLRDIVVNLESHQSKLFHMGLSRAPARSTLADALNLRDWRIYQALAMKLIRRARELYAHTCFAVELDATVYALDATVIDLCLSLFAWAPFRSTKAAIKLHTLLDLRGAIPAFIHISDGKMGDVSALDLLPIEAGAFYIMDRGYLDYSRLFAMHQTGAFFVTRAKRDTNARRVYSAESSREDGVICDQRIYMNGRRIRQDYPELLRRIRFKDPDTGKTLIFLTNNMGLPALSIAALYKARWQVELFFKWIKQHLRIKRFLASTENAVKTQIWCAVATYVLIAIIKRELALKSPLYRLLQILSLSLFEKNELLCALQPTGYKTHATYPANQLILFDY